MGWTERYVRADADGTGDGTTNTNSGANGAYTWAQMLADTTAGSIRYNVRYDAEAAGGYSRGGSADTMTTAGGQSTPRYIRGFHSTIGDLWANGRTAGGALITTNFPLITYTSGSFVAPAWFIIESLSFTSTRTNGTVTAGANAQNILRRCYFENTNGTSSASACGLSIGDSYTQVIDCDTYCSTTNAAAKALTASRAFVYGGLHRCTSGIALSGSTFIFLADCMVRDSATGFSGGGTMCTIENCSFRNISGTVISNSGSSQIMLRNNIAWGDGSGTKWYDSPTFVRSHIQRCNAIGNMGTADTREGDWLVTDEIALTADPFVSSSDLQLNNTSGGGAECRGVGMFGRDLGAWQPAGGGGGGPSGFPLGRLVV